MAITLTSRAVPRTATVPQPLLLLLPLVPLTFVLPQYLIIPGAKMSDTSD